MAAVLSGHGPSASQRPFAWNYRPDPSASVWRPGDFVRGVSAYSVGLADIRGRGGCLSGPVDADKAGNLMDCRAMGPKSDAKEQQFLRALSETEFAAGGASWQRGNFGKERAGYRDVP